jgi:uncharacterized membrane protein YphA (DoxX/SURF4 family)
MVVISLNKRVIVLFNSSGRHACRSFNLLLKCKSEFLFIIKKYFMEQSMDSKTKNGRSIWIPLARMVLGIMLIWKGLAFIQDTSELQLAIQRTGTGEYAGSLDVVAAVVSILTLVSGIFVMVGFFTKITSYVQIAIIFLGMVFIYSTGIARNGFEMISTFIILSLLVFFANKGSGLISFDAAIKKK